MDEFEVVLIIYLELTNYEVVFSLRFTTVVYDTSKTVF